MLSDGVCACNRQARTHTRGLWRCGGWRGRTSQGKHKAAWGFCKIDRMRQGTGKPDSEAWDQDVWGTERSPSPGLSDLSASGTWELWGEVDSRIHGHSTRCVFIVTFTIFQIRVPARAAWESSIRSTGGMYYIPSYCNHSPRRSDGETEAQRGYKIHTWLLTHVPPCTPISKPGLPLSEKGKNPCWLSGNR